MKIRLEVTKRELGLLLRGLACVLIEESDSARARSSRTGNRWMATRRFVAAEALEHKLAAAILNTQHTEVPHVGGQDQGQVSGDVR